MVLYLDALDRCVGSRMPDPCRRQGERQRGAPSRNPALHGAHGDVEHGRDLGVVEIRHVTKHDRQSIFLAE
jgi:hypothetical protein